MYVVVGASGHTGQVVAKTLLDAKQKVRVAGRDAARLQPLAAQGAEVAITDVTDNKSLAQAFQGADAAYVMIPPNVNSNDTRGYQDRVSNAITSAVRGAGIQHVVTLSSIGANKPSGTGPVVGLRYLEEQLNQIDGLNALHLRPGYFMYNTLPQAGVIRATGNSIGPLRADLKLPMIATRDIGNAAAQALLRRDFQGKQTRELLGPRDLDLREAATIIGKAIGKPSLNYVQAPGEQLRPAFEQLGMSANFVALLLEMVDSLNSGHMRAMEPRSAANTTPTTYETFVKEEFVPAYEQQKAA